MKINFTSSNLCYLPKIILLSIYKKKIINENSRWLATVYHNAKMLKFSKKNAFLFSYLSFNSLLLM